MAINQILFQLNIISSTAKKQLKDFEDSLNDLTDGFNQLTSATKVFLEYSRQFEVNMRNLNSIALQSEEQFKKTTQAVIDFSSKESRNGLIDLSDALYQVYSSGYKGAEGLAILQASALGAEAGASGTRDMLEATVSVLHSFGLEATQSTEIVNSFLKTVQDGVITLTQLSHVIGQAVTIAPELGIQLNEIEGALVGLTRQGLSAEESVTVLNNVLNTFLSPSEEAVTYAKAIGLEFNSSAFQGHTFAEVIHDISEKTHSNNQVISKLFGNVRGLKGFFKLAKDEARSFEEYSKAIATNTDATAKALEQQRKTFDSAVKGLKSNFEVLMQTFGNMSSTVIKPFISFLSEVLKQFNNLNPSIKNIITSFISLSAVIIPSGIALAGLITAVGSLATVFGGPLLLSIGLVTTAFVSLTVAYSNMRNAIDESKQSWEEHDTAVNEAKSNIDSLIKKQDELRKQGKELSTKDLKALKYAYATLVSNLTYKKDSRAELYKKEAIAIQETLKSRKDVNTSDQEFFNNAKRKAELLEDQQKRDKRINEDYIKATQGQYQADISLAKEKMQERLSMLEDEKRLGVKNEKEYQEYKAKIVKTFEDEKKKALESNSQSILNSAKKNTKDYEKIYSLELRNLSLQQKEFIEIVDKTGSERFKIELDLAKKTKNIYDRQAKDSRLSLETRQEANFKSKEQALEIQGLELKLTKEQEQEKINLYQKSNAKAKDILENRLKLNQISEKEYFNNYIDLQLRYKEQLEVSLKNFVGNKDKKEQLEIDLLNLTNEIEQRKYDFKTKLLNKELEANKVQKEMIRTLDYDVYTEFLNIEKNKQTAVQNELNLENLSREEANKKLIESYNNEILLLDDLLKKKKANFEDTESIQESIQEKINKIAEINYTNEKNLIEKRITLVRKSAKDELDVIDNLSKEGKINIFDKLSRQKEVNLFVQRSLNDELASVKSNSEQQKQILEDLSKTKQELIQIDIEKQQELNKVVIDSLKNIGQNLTESPNQSFSNFGKELNESVGEATEILKGGAGDITAIVSVGTKYIVSELDAVAFKSQDIFKKTKDLGRTILETMLNMVGAFPVYGNVWKSTIEGILNTFGVKTTEQINSAIEQVDKFGGKLNDLLPSIWTLQSEISDLIFSISGKISNQADKIFYSYSNAFANSEKQAKEYLNNIKQIYYEAFETSFKATGNQDTAQKYAESIFNSLLEKYNLFSQQQELLNKKVIQDTIDLNKSYSIEIKKMNADLITNSEQKNRKLYELEKARIDLEEKDETKKTLKLRLLDKQEIERRNARQYELSKLRIESIDNELTRLNELYKIERINIFNTVKDTAIQKVMLFNLEKKYTNDLISLNKKLNDDKLNNLKEQEDFEVKLVEARFNAEKRFNNTRNDLMKQQLKADISNIDIIINKLKQTSDEYDKLREKFKQELLPKNIYSDFAKATQGLSATSSFYRTPLEKFNLDIEQKRFDIEKDLASNKITVEESLKRYQEIAVQRSVYLTNLASQLVKGTKERLDIEKEAQNSFNDYKESALELYDLETKKIDNINSQKIETLEIEKTTKENQLNELNNQESLLIEQIKNKYDLLANDYNGKMLEGVKNWSNETSKAIEQAKNQLKDLNQQVNSTIANTPTTTFKTVTTAQAQSSSNMLYQNEQNKIGTALTGIKLGNSIASLIPNFDSGGITKTGGLAMLHPSEMVLNPSQQENLFNILQPSNSMSTNKNVNVVVNVGNVNGNVNDFIDTISYKIKNEIMSNY